MSYGDESADLRELSEIESDLSSEVESILIKDDPRRYYQVQKGAIAKQDNENFYLTKKLSNQALYMMKTLNMPDKRQNDALVREIALMRSLNSDCVLRCTAAYFFQGRIWLFQEFMDGGNLQNLISLLEPAEEILSEEFCMYTLFKIITGLHAMHSENLLHRGLNSENIYLDFNGEIKLGDLGVSVHLTKEQRLRETRLQTVPNWYSPEIIKGCPYSKEIDVWALGITAYQLASGRLPFTSATSAVNQSSETNGNINSLASSMVTISTLGVPKLPNHRSANFKDFVSKCTEVKPENRWNTSMLIYHPFLQGAEDLRAHWI